ncbi:MAG: nucleoside deaminase [Magnetococcales bacterium]|nr:nucleoside deaminase [Magnetococcales bacterium]
MSAWLPAERAVLLLSLVAAAEAGAGDEVPVGAVLTDDQGRLLAVRGNDCIAGSDPVGHAEMRVLRQAAGRLRNYRLCAARLTVSLEPCPMCRQAAGLARVAGIRYAARRNPAAASLQDPMASLDPTYETVAVALLQFFFSARRADLNSGEESVLIP